MVFSCSFGASVNQPLPYSQTILISLIARRFRVSGNAYLDTVPSSNAANIAIVIYIKVEGNERLLEALSMLSQTNFRHIRSYSYGTGCSLITSSANEYFGAAQSSNATTSALAIYSKLVGNEWPSMLIRSFLNPSSLLSIGRP